jgi:hypothetical protein
MPVFIRVAPVGTALPTTFAVNESANAITPVTNDPAEKSTRRRSSVVQTLMKATGAGSSASGVFPAPSLVSPRGQPVGMDARHPMRTEADGVFNQTTADADVVQVISRHVTPLVTARKNVVLFFDGPSGAGKTCLAEQVFMNVMNAIKPAIAAADEALREAAVLSADGAPQGAEGTRKGRGDGQSGSKSTEASSGVKINPNRVSVGRSVSPARQTVAGGASNANGATTIPSSMARSSSSQAGRSSSIGRRGASKSRPWSSLAGGASSKFSLICALPRGGSDGGEVVQLRALSPSRLGDTRLIPDLTDPSLVSPLRSRPASALGGSGGGSFGRIIAGGSPSRRGGPSDDSMQKGIFRLSLARARSPLKYDDSPARPASSLASGQSPSTVGLRRGANGRCAAGAEGLRYVHFDGRQVLDIPRWPFVDKLLQTKEGVRVSFWLCPDDLATTAAGLAPDRKPTPQCILELFDPLDSRYRFTIQIHSSGLGDFELGGLKVGLRDASGRRLDVHFETAIRDGAWQFVSIDAAPGANTVTAAVNGRAMRSKLISQEGPNSFDPDRAKFGRLGARMVQTPGETTALCDHYHGYMADLCVGPPAIVEEPLCHYPLDKRVNLRRGHANDDEGGGGESDDDLSPEDAGPMLVEVRSKFPALTPSPLAAQKIAVEPADFVACAPAFDGYTACVSCGTVGDALLRLPSATIDFFFRTTNVNGLMTAIGVTDVPGKHVGFGVDFNSSIGGSFQRGSICLWLRDYNGKLARCAFDAPEIFDGVWHKLAFRILDPDAARFRVKVDHKIKTDGLTTTGRARRDFFLCASTAITIGCHNDRGTRKNFFQGGLRHVRIRAANADGEPDLIAHWPLDEGPGAAIAVDASGHGYNGVHWARGRRAGLAWLPIDTESGYGLGERGEGSASDSKHVKVVRYDNNVIQFAAVAVRATVLPSSLVREEIVNLLPLNSQHNATGGGTVTVAASPTLPSSFELDPIPCASSNDRLNSGDRRTLYCLPQDAFMEVTSNDYLQVIRSAVHKAGEMTHCHLLYVLRLGDATFTTADFVGITKSQRARFVPRQLAWVDTVCTLGTKAKQTNAMNRGTADAQHSVARYGAHPNTYKRSTFFDRSQSFDVQSVAGNLITHALLGGSGHAAMCYCAVLSPQATVDELASVTSVMDVMRTSDERSAATLIQKQVRALLARRIFASLREGAHDCETRQSHRDSMRRMYPSQCNPRTKRTCLIVNLALGVPGTLAAAQPGVTEAIEEQRLSDAYAAAGYLVQSLRAPTNAAAVFAAIDAVATEKDEMLCCHVIGLRYDGSRTFEAPDDATSRRWLEEECTLRRLAVEEERFGRDDRAVW